MTTGKRVLINIIVLAVFALIFVLAWFTVFTRAAGAATCAARPGVSHGAVWWRYRFDRRTGARCWYPGERHRHFPRPQIRSKKLTPGTIAPLRSDPVAEPGLRTVQTVPIDAAGRTPAERVDDGFDVLILFPAAEANDGGGPNAQQSIHAKR